MRSLIWTLILAMQLPLLAAADLVVSTVQPDVTNMAPAPSGSQTVTVIVRNIGNANAFNFVVAFYSNRSQSCTTGLTPEDQVTISSLPAGTQIPITYVLHSRPGDTTIYAVAKADTGNVVPENSESNNCLTSFAITVQNPDLVPFGLIGPARMVPGGDAQPFNFEIKNQGTSTTGWFAGLSSARYYLSTASSNPPLADRLSIATPTPGLDIGEQVHLTQEIGIAANVPLGTYNLFAMADGNNQIFERNETNNFDPVSVELVSQCTLADVNLNGRVDVLDLVLLVNGSVALATPANQNLNLRRSLPPFPEIINRDDFFVALPCFGSLNLEDLESGTFTDFAIVNLNNGNFRIDSSLTGAVTAVDVLIKMPTWANLTAAVGLDALSSGYTTSFALGSGETLLANEFHTTSVVSRTVSGAVAVATLSSDLNLSATYPVSNVSSFDMGVAVHVTFGDGTRKVIMRRFDYANLPDQVFRSAMETQFGLTPGTPIPGSSLRTLTTLDLRNIGIQDMTGIHAFTNLWFLYMQDNNIEVVPDLSMLTGLRTLYLHNNQIRAYGPLPSSLELLHLAENELKAVNHLENLTNLRSFQLTVNHLTSLPPLLHLTKLTSLSVNVNELAEIPPLPASVTNLILDKNRLTSLPDLSGNRLYQLSAHSNYLSDISAITSLNFSPNAMINLYENNLGKEDCPDITTLASKGRLTIIPQRFMLDPCLKVNDQ